MDTNLPGQGAPTGAGAATPNPSDPASADQNLDAILKRIDERLDQRFKDFETRSQRGRQSDRDKVTARIRKDLGPQLKAIDEIGLSEGWDSKKIADKKNEATSARMTKVFTEDDEDDTVNTVRQEALQAWMKDNLDLEPADLDLSAYVGLDVNDPRGSAFYKAAAQKAAEKLRGQPDKTAEKIAKALETQGDSKSDLGAGPGRNPNPIEKVTDPDELFKLTGLARKKSKN